MALSCWAVVAARWSYNPQIRNLESLMLQQDRKSKVKHKFKKLKGGWGEGMAFLYGSMGPAIVVLVLHGSTIVERTSAIPLLISML